MGPVRPVIDAMLREDLDAPRKQRHAARLVFTDGRFPKVLGRHSVDRTCGRPCPNL